VSRASLSAEYAEGVTLLMSVRGPFEMAAPR
jgi:hypothetical protein